MLPDCIHPRQQEPLGQRSGLSHRPSGSSAFSIPCSPPGPEIISSGPAGYARMPCGGSRFIKPHRALVDAGMTNFLMVWKERAGIPVKVTAFERTLVDVLHRPGRAGGRDEVNDSLATALSSSGASIPGRRPTTSSYSASARWLAWSAGGWMAGSRN